MSVVARARVVEDDVISGLRQYPKRLPVRLLYDARGADLFDQITGLDEYYPTRTEFRLLDAHLRHIASEVGVAARVIEPGSGVGIKTKRLLRALDEPAIYVGIDVARDALVHGIKVLRSENPDLEAHAVVADFTKPFTLPAPKRPYGKTLVFFPGSTIGNFEPHDAVAFLGNLRTIAGANARLVIGADGTRDPRYLVPAYNDREGVTAEFNLNVLVHLNRTRNTDFKVEQFRHRAVWNDMLSRIEMHLVSLVDQVVTVDDESVSLTAGESIVTEYSYKHSLHAMRGMLQAAGWDVGEVFTGPEQPMRLWLCEPRSR
jgi:dimethylhistidine N-methyltransferase